MTKQSREKSPWLFKGFTDKSNFLQFTFKSTRVDTTNLVGLYHELYRKLVKAEGKLAAVKRLKDLYGIALRHSSGVDYDPLPFTRSNKKGFPRVLNPWRSLLEGSPDTKRAALSTLQLYKLVEVKGKHDLRSISDPYSGNTSPEWLQSFDEVIKEMFPSPNYPLKIAHSGFHISGKNGPNGPSMGMMHVDYESIRSTPLEMNIRKLATLTGNDSLTQIMDSIPKHEPVCKRDDKRRPTHSRLRIKYEAGGKARVFCILDFFTQSVLEPLHDKLMEWLGSQIQDGTNDHAHAAEAVRIWSGTDSKLWSFDLTTATDRYPVFLQKRVMVAMFGEEIAELWKEIISDRDFITPSGDSTVRFSVGQPLGALSSWAAFAVTHHAHVRTAAKLSNVESHDLYYRIIGDDICIRGSTAVAQEYVRMMNDLGVKFSLAKSIIPDQCNQVNAAELAKRVFVNGHEVTPVPPDNVISHMREPFGKRILIETAISRDYGMMQNPYTVQSIMSSEHDWAALTFPVGRTLPPLKGVKVVLASWEMLDEDLPGSLDPGWIFWSTRPFDLVEEDYFFEELLKDFLVQEVESAIRSATESKYSLYELRWALPGAADEVGDWKPSLPSIAPDAYEHVLDGTMEKYNELIREIRSNSSRDRDLYRMIARIHSVVAPDMIFGRKTNFRDDKTKTKAFANRLVKLAERAGRQGIYPIDTLPFGFRTLRKKLIE
jgi:hypothetical protein